ncbi:glyoxalase/bleomycin resistance/dioxygenase family protein [Microbispora amethystogenes]|uniref:glyoxalase/bleomycin resistance/dioxygenase family protein n=1 Tax=Microbispora amethystogenes TaxID=1427754 RepID=UPI0033E7C265
MSIATTATTRITLLVLYTGRMEECRAFYSALGIEFVQEQHGSGPQHYAAVLPDGTVFELYPATAKRRTGAVRLGFNLDGTTVTPPLEPGRHLLTDPDGRTVEVHAT